MHDTFYLQTMTLAMATSLACDLFQQSKLRDCCGAIKTLNATGSGNADLDVVALLMIQKYFVLAIILVE
jgi:hypothetical protein